MKLKTIVLTISLLSLFSLLFPSLTHANTISPHSKELLITNQERTKETLSFTNDSTKEVLITPVIYSYDPQTLEMDKNEGYFFLRADREIFTIEPKETLQLKYEVVPTENMRPGTYFNLIILQKESEDIFVEQINPIGAVDSLAHLVTLHIADPESAVYGITSEFANISIEVLEEGIPYLRPTVIKYTYENVTDYVLNPMGEIQIYSEKGNYAPTYLKINREQEKLYPGGLLEEEFEIEQYHISDLYSNRVIIGRFYNGIDENLMIKEIVSEPNYILLGGVGIIILITIILLKALLTKNPKRKNNSKKNPV
jgi:hypothetical protein